MRLIQERFRLVHFYTCYGSAGIDGASDSPADEGNATLMDAHKPPQKKKMMMLFLSGALVMCLMFNKFVKQVMFFL